jgi:hypothetical protein
MVGAPVLVGARRELISGKNLGNNLLLNSALANNGAGWNLATTTITANGLNGANAFSLLGTGSYQGTILPNQDNIPVVIGGVYTAAMYLNGANITGGGGEMLVQCGGNHSSGVSAVTGVLKVTFTATATACNYLSRWNSITITSGQYSYITPLYLIRIA